MKRAVLIAGPTASGKSALALDYAQRTGGVVINADAMQVYRGLVILTAGPGAPDLRRAEHRLYGVLDPAERFSTGRWLAFVRETLDALDGQTAVFVGGTGLYFHALLHGMAEVPPVPAHFVEQAMRAIAGLDAGGREALLASRDPLMAGRIAAADPQRIVRALAVHAATGRSLASFQTTGQSGLLEDYAVERIVLEVDRAILAKRIAERFTRMLDSGAIAEVEGLLARGLDPQLPAMKAIGVAEIRDLLAGRIDRERAIELGTIATRQYAKRQRTWLRNRMSDWRRLAPEA